MDVYWGLTSHWVSWLMMEFNEKIAIDSDGGGNVAAGNVLSLLSNRFVHRSGVGDADCGTTFDDPTQVFVLYIRTLSSISTANQIKYVFDKLRAIAFRTAVAAARVTDNATLFGPAEEVEQGYPLIGNWTQQVALKGEKRVSSFSISIPYLVCAVILSLLSVLAMAPTYWKLWTRKTILLTFNPLEVAHVFGAPILQHADSEKTMEAYIRKESGLRRIKHVTEESDDASGSSLAQMRPD